MVSSPHRSGCRSMNRLPPQWRPPMCVRISLDKQLSQFPIHLCARAEVPHVWCQRRVDAHTSARRLGAAQYLAPASRQSAGRAPRGPRPLTSKAARHTIVAAMARTGEERKEASGMRTVRAFLLTLFILVVSGIGASPGAAAPEGQMTWGVHISLAPTWFDPAETPGIGTPFMILYALHDALVKPMPGNAMAPSLAESWSVSKDGLVYEFVLRPGARFHNGEPVTADDVKFSFERYRGAAARLMKEKVAAVEVVDPGRVRFRLREPWPDFMTYYGSLATGAGWIVPRKYLEKVGDDGFKKAPVGAGPYRFVSFNPGVELVLEAYEPYWRKSPSVKRL